MGAGTRCEGQLAAFEALNRRIQQETRAIFDDFEASIGRESERHTVRLHSCDPAPKTVFRLAHLVAVYTSWVVWHYRQLCHRYSAPHRSSSCLSHPHSDTLNIRHHFPKAKSCSSFV